MVTQSHTAAEAEAKVALNRNRLVLEQAKAIGLLGTAKNTRLSGRVPLGVGRGGQEARPCYLRHRVAGIGTFPAGS